MADDPNAGAMFQAGASQPIQQAAQQQPPRQQAPRQPGSRKKYYTIAIIVIVIAVAAFVLASGGSAFGGSHSAKAIQIYQEFQSKNYTGVLTTMEGSIGSAQKLNATYQGKLSYSISMLGISQSGSSPVLIRYMKDGDNSSAYLQISNGTSSNSSLGASSLLGGLSGLGGSLILRLNGNTYACNATGGACTSSSSSTVSSLNAMVKNVTINVTNGRTSYSSYKGQGCILSQGDYRIKRSSSALTGGLSGGQLQAMIAGNYSACVSETYLLPLTMQLSISNFSVVSGGSTTSVAIRATVQLNATSINNNTNTNEIVSQIKLSGNCYSIIGVLTEYTCANAQVGTNGVMNVTIYNNTQSPFGSDTSSGTSQVSAKVACLTYTLNFTTPLPSSEYHTINPIAVGSSEAVTVQCYNSQGIAISPAPGSIFIGTLYINASNVFSPYEVGAVQTKVGSSPITLSAQPAQPIPKPSGITSSANVSSCGSFNLSTAIFGTHLYGTCTWSGGTIYIFAASGDSGYISYRVSGGPTNTTYISNSTNARCSSYMGSTYLPAQTYYVKISTGAGGGNCGDAALQLSSS